MNGREASSVFQTYASQLGEELAELRGLKAELEMAREGVEKERSQVAAALAAVYLPELTQPALDAAEKRAGFRGFSQRKPLLAMERERTRLQRSIAELEADDKWKEREALAGPMGRLVRGIDEAREMLEPWEADCARFEVLDGFQELVDIGYDTPAFQERWWEPGYWRHWARGDAICAALGLADFGDDVLPAWRAVSEPRNKWRAERDRLYGELNAVHAHVQKHDELADRLENLAVAYLGECRKLLADHLARADVQLLSEWCGDDRAVLVQLRRLSGLSAKAAMLDDMRVKWLEPMIGTIGQNQGRFQVKAGKLARPKKWGVQVTMPAGFEEKLLARRARRAKARSQMARIVSFNAYERWDLRQDDELWWLLMHDNRRPGIFAPSYADWYQRHPNVKVVDDPDWAEARGQPLQARAALADTSDVS
jgi:hypothetical protein